MTKHQKSRLGTDLWRSHLHLISLLPMFWMIYHLKFSILDANGGGFEYAADLLGLRSAAELSVFQKLSLFRSEILCFLCAFPIILLSLLSQLNPVGRALFCGLIGVIVACVLFIELKCFWEVGTFLPFSILIAGIQKNSGKEVMAEYLPLFSLLKQLIVVLSIIVSSWILGYFDTHKSFSNTTARRFTFAYWLIVLVVLLASLRESLPQNPYSTNASLAALKEFLSTDTLGSAGDSIPEDGKALVSEYAQLALLAPTSGPSKYFSKAAGYDVLSFVLETAPAHVVDLEKNLLDFPVLSELSGEAFIAPRHYTTYPYTTRALYSLYSSLYPSNARLDFVRGLATHHPNLTSPGLARSLKQLGYRTAVIEVQSFDGWEYNHVRYPALGFQELIAPASALNQDISPHASVEEIRAERRRRDLLALDMLKKKIRSSVASKQPYFYAFHPQLSHGPWPNPPEERNEANLLHEGTVLFQEEIGWLKEVVDLLRELGTLRRTLIVVTGDHGIRTRTEHPFFNGGTLSDITYRVPFFLYAPGVVNEKTLVPFTSSHIDVVPTLLDLLGSRDFRQLEQGIPIWDPRLRSRRTFLLGKSYLGADGYLEENQASMVRYIFNLSFLHQFHGSQSSLPLLAFSHNDSLPFDSTESKNILRTLEHFERLQARFAMTLIPKNFAKVFSETAPPSSSTREISASESTINNRLAENGSSPQEKRNPQFETNLRQ